MTDKILTITASDMTPLVKELLQKLVERQDLIERLYEEVQTLKEENRILKDEIIALKKSPRRPKIKANKKNKALKRQDGFDSTNAKRPGSEKKSKSLEIHETKVIRPDDLPEGSKLKRTRSFDVQDLLIQIHNIRYELEEWETPDGKIYSAQMPAGVSQGHFGIGLCSFILDQHHQCQVTQPLLHEQLKEFGVDISTGQLHNILSEGNDLFHQEKNEILQSGLKVSSYIQVDDTGARHEGQNGYCTQIGNELFAWFQSTKSKSRINFLEILSSVYPDAGYLLNELSFEYMLKEKLSQVSLEKLKISIKKNFQNKIEWHEWLKKSRITKKNHIRIATEATLLAGALEGGLNKQLVILSDDAGQFNIPFLTHALCWIHEERHIKKLIPSTEENRILQQQVLDSFWILYKNLKKYKLSPTPELKNKLQMSFDELFTKKTGYASLDLVLKRTFNKKKELLVVLEKNDLPLHNNGSETDIREYVKRRKVSGGTRSLSGQQSRDTFASLKKTCRKLGLSFYAYLKDRLSGTYKIAKLGSLIEETAAKKVAQIEIIEGVAA
jgi:hypothetical protein